MCNEGVRRSTSDILYMRSRYTVIRLYFILRIFFITWEEAILSFLRKSANNA